MKRRNPIKVEVNIESKNLNKDKNRQSNQQKERRVNINNIQFKDQIDGQKDNIDQNQQKQLYQYKSDDRNRPQFDLNKSKITMNSQVPELSIYLHQNLIKRVLQIIRQN
ncbi:unnamed protein product [Paramecium sonneborni]|uniref:Uncharacterized protein n=1 Tax=Paramecium sonneborni TaxID=65129 RepID=A0A8S1R9M3_9CILI|nr:unnamed protein product [Paramecium sonneborni]